MERVMAEFKSGERRQHPRVCLPFPATVEGVNEEGVAFHADTILDDLSVGGLYLRVVERVRENSELSIETRLSTVADRGIVLSLKGRVLRVDPKPGGAYGVAMLIEERHYL
jgi:hypothetical protein